MFRALTDSTFNERDRQQALSLIDEVLAQTRIPAALPGDAGWGV
ncbi:MAG: hypothetical protein ABI885_30210 [Gammaproteobacteria bacterium]